jgi:hypothetical protein
VTWIALLVGLLVGRFVVGPLAERRRRLLAARRVYRMSDPRHRPWECSACRRLAERDGDPPPAPPIPLAEARTVRR